jgi:putative sterol carrier protein
MADITVEKIIQNHPDFFNPEAAEGVDAVIQYELTGEEASDWMITIKDGTCSYAQGKAESPTMTLFADSQDFKDVLTGKANGMQYFMMGKIRLAGDLNLAMKLTSMFRMSGQ